MTNPKIATLVAAAMALLAIVTFFLIDDWLPVLSFWGNTLTGHFTFLGFRVAYGWIASSAAAAICWAAFVVYQHPDWE